MHGSSTPSSAGPALPRGRSGRHTDPRSPLRMRTTGRLPARGVEPPRYAHRSLGKQLSYEERVAVRNFEDVSIPTERSGKRSVQREHRQECVGLNHDMGPAAESKSLQYTLPPRTTSTDSWATSGNQTVLSYESSKRVPLNDWIREHRS